MKEYIEREEAVRAAKDGADEWDGGYSRYRDASIKSAMNAIPAADVVDGETYRELLKVAKKMHCWIFLNTDDELGAYDECGLTDEMNALLGYDGQFTVKIDGGADDEQ